MNLIYIKCSLIQFLRLITGTFLSENRLPQKDSRFITCCFSVSISQPLYFSISLTLCLAVCLCKCLCVCLSMSLSVQTYVYLSVGLFICLSRIFSFFVIFSLYVSNQVWSLTSLFFIFSHLDLICQDGPRVSVCLCVPALQPKRLGRF